VVRIWQEMHRAQDGEPHTGGETFALAYERNLVAQKDLAAAAAVAKEQRESLIRVAEEHGISRELINTAPTPAESIEAEWDEWLRNNG
jgi:hypothetical protein